MDARPIEQFNVLRENFVRITSPWLLTSLYETVKNISSTVNRVQRSGREVHGVLSAHLCRGKESAWRVVGVSSTR